MFSLTDQLHFGNTGSNRFGTIFNLCFYTVGWIVMDRDRQRMKVLGDQKPYRRIFLKSRPRDDALIEVYELISSGTY